MIMGMYDDVANCKYPSFAALYDLIAGLNISLQAHIASHRKSLRCFAQSKTTTLKDLGLPACVGHLTIGC